MYACMHVGMYMNAWKNRWMKFLLSFIQVFYFLCVWLAGWHIFMCKLNMRVYVWIGIFGRKKRRKNLLFSTTNELRIVRGWRSASINRKKRRKKRNSFERKKSKKFINHGNFLFVLVYIHFSLQLTKSYLTPLFWLG